MNRITTLAASLAVGALVALGAAAPAHAVEDPIYLPAPVQVDECGTENDTIETPDVEGVLYGVYDYSGRTTAPSWDAYGWEAGDGILVIAGPNGGTWFFDDTPVEVEPSDYGVDSRGNVGWWFPAFTDAPCEAAALIEVTPERPKWSDPAGPGNATWIYTDQASHHYVIDYPANGRIRVTAVANPGYVFADGAQTHWGRPEVN